MLTIYLCIEKTLGKKLTKYHIKYLFLWICTLSFLFCGRSQQKISLDINECQLLCPLEQSAHRDDSYWIYFKYKGKRWTQKNCWPSRSHVIRSFVPLCYPMHFVLPLMAVSVFVWLCDVSYEINFNLPHSMSICLWHRAIVGYIREVKIAAVKKA